jgi:SNF2 family DNA or RNA helicase
MVSTTGEKKVDIVQKIALDTIAPLCPATQAMFQPIHLAPSDRLVIKMNKDGTHFNITYTGRIEDREVYPSYNARVRFNNILPSKTKIGHSGEKWLIEATDITALLICFHWEREQLVFLEPAAHQTYVYLITNFIAQTRRVQNREHLNGFSFLDSKEYPLKDHQKKALKACINTEGFGLFMEQGTGKTAIAIARICNEAQRKFEKGEGLYYCLIAVPKSVRLNWENEIKKFASVKGETQVIQGTEIDRVKNIIEAVARTKADPTNKFLVCIISMDSAGNTEEALSLPPWDLFILDESHGIKNPGTKRWKAMRKLRDRAKARMVLSGTPITNTMFDLWSQFEFMGQGWSGFNTFDKFRKFYGVYENNQQDQAGYAKLVALNNVPMIQERLARQAFLIKKSEALPDLPNKVYDIYEVEMTSEQKEAYRQLCETLILEMESSLAAAEREGRGKDIMIVNNILTQMLRLSQITSGFISFSKLLDEDGNCIQEAKTNRFDPDPKLEALVEILKEKEPHQKTIVWSNYVQNIRTISARLRLEGIDCVTYYGATSSEDRETAVRRFNEDPNCKVFIGNPRAGGVGITLLGYPIGGEPNTYCDHVIYYAQNWSAVDRAQSEDRPHRIGTVTHVRYTDLVVPNSIDMEIREAVTNKRLNALKIQDVKIVISRIMGGYTSA